LIYYNQAKFMTDEMNKADNKKYEEMKPKRDELITKALPYLGKAREIMEGDKGNEAYKSMYRETMTGLMNCYNVQNKTEQAAEIKKILDIKK